MSSTLPPGRANTCSTPPQQQPGVRVPAPWAEGLRQLLERAEAAMGERYPFPENPRWYRELRGSLETALAQQTTLIASLRIPLAEPPGFQALLAAMFGESFFLQNHVITDCQGRLVADYPDSAHCIHGHIDIASLRQRFPYTQPITWVTDPAERVAAHYRYWQQTPDWGNPLCRMLHEQSWTLVEFARQDAARNEITRSFGTLRPEDFAFIGLSDVFIESVYLLRHTFRVTAVPLFEDFQQSELSRPNTPIPDGLRREISRLNEADCALVADCRRWFRQRSSTLPGIR